MIDRSQRKVVGAIIWFDDYNCGSSVALTLK